MLYGDGLLMIRFSALDTLAQVSLHEGNLTECRQRLSECDELLRQFRLPARSWYDLALPAHPLRLLRPHSTTGPRSSASVTRPTRNSPGGRYKAVRTSLLCAKARALARLGKSGHADSALAAAVRTCPRGAVDPLIVLEASKALCVSLRGDVANGAVHFDRALAACRAIGHRYHEAWIDARRARTWRRSDPASRVAGPPASSTSPTPRCSWATSPPSSAPATRSTCSRTAWPRFCRAPRSARASRSTASQDCEYQPEPTRRLGHGADGTFTSACAARTAASPSASAASRTIDEISLLKSVADLVQAAVNRTADTETEDEDQNLWPRAQRAGRRRRRSSARRAWSSC